VHYNYPNLNIQVYVESVAYFGCCRPVLAETCFATMRHENVARNRQQSLFYRSINGQAATFAARSRTAGRKTAVDRSVFKAATTVFWSIVTRDVELSTHSRACLFLIVNNRTVV
jgi:hypothetical protein